MFLTLDDCVDRSCVCQLLLDEYMMMMMMNVDFSSSSPNPLGSRKPAQAGVKDSYLSKKWLFYRNYLV